MGLGDVEGSQPASPLMLRQCAVGAVERWSLLARSRTETARPSQERRVSAQTNLWARTCLISRPVERTSEPYPVHGVVRSPVDVLEVAEQGRRSVVPPPVTTDHHSRPSLCPPRRSEWPLTGSLRPEPRLHRAHRAGRRRWSVLERRMVTAKPSAAPVSRRPAWRRAG